MSETPRLILASASPRRHQLLGDLGIAFDVHPADVEELEDSTHGPAHLVDENTRRKGRAVAEVYPDRPVLASDTTVALDGSILNKPADLDEARAMLRRLSGRTHEVHTAVGLFWHAREIEDLQVVTSRVTFQKLSEEGITGYFEIVNPLDKAGAYGIQEGRERIIAGWVGSLTNIMGLPVDETRSMLERYRLWCLDRAGVER